MKLTIQASEVLSDVQLGDSISVNGVCLTVTDFAKMNFQQMSCPKHSKALRFLPLKNEQKSIWRGRCRQMAVLAGTL